MNTASNSDVDSAGLHDLDGRARPGPGLAPVAAQSAGPGKRQQGGPIVGAERIEGGLRRPFEESEGCSLDAPARIQREQHAHWNIRDGRRLDPLDDALVEQLKVVGSETCHRPAAVHDPHVHADHIHAGAKSLLALHVTDEGRKRRRAARQRTDGTLDGECAAHAQAVAPFRESRFRLAGRQADRRACCVTVLTSHHGWRDEMYAIRSTMSLSVRLATTGFISADMAPRRVPSLKSYICRAR